MLVLIVILVTVSLARAHVANFRPKIGGVNDSTVLGRDSNPSARRRPLNISSLTGRRLQRRTNTGTPVCPPPP